MPSSGSGKVSSTRSWVGSRRRRNSASSQIQTARSFSLSLIKMSFVFCTWSQSWLAEGVYLSTSCPRIRNPPWGISSDFQRSERFWHQQIIVLDEKRWLTIKMQMTSRQPLKIIRSHHIFNLQYSIWFSILNMMQIILTSRQPLKIVSVVFLCSACYLLSWSLVWS